MADFYEYLGPGRSGAKKSTYHRRFNRMAFGLDRGGDRCRCGSNGRCRRHTPPHHVHLLRRSEYHLRTGSVTGDAHFFFALGDFEFGDAGFFDQINELFQLA